MVVELIYFGLMFWCGLYVMNRDMRNVNLLLTGLGILTCSIGYGAAIVLPYSQGSQPNMALVLGKVVDICSYMPLVLWQSAVLSMLSSQSHQRNVLWSSWKYGVTPLILGSVVWLGVVSDLAGYRMSYTIVLCTVLLLLLLFSVGGAVSDKTKRSMTFYFFSYVPLLVFIGIAALWLIHPSNDWDERMLSLHGAGMLLYGGYTLIREVKEQGETWLPDLFRSLDYSIFFTLIFSGQVALVVMLGTETGFNATTLSLLMISMMVSIAFQVFVYPIRAILDNFALMMFPKLRSERSKLRLVETVQVRIDEESKPEEMDEEELYRLIRRALSNLGNLERLAASPLTQLQIIDERLRESGAGNGVLERANELKSLLIHGIMQMKPRQDEPFGTTEEWKFYNALYYPYVIGIKPYSVRYSDDQLDQASKDALDWFRTYVPERTCYNWQNAGSRLIATSLREKNMIPRAL